MTEPLEIRVEDAVVCRGYFAGVKPGLQVERREKVVRDNPERFVPVVPEGVDRQDCLFALETLRHSDDEGGWEVVYKGLDVRRDNWFASVHPEQFATEPPEVW
jgi:hypothetical protein